MSIIDIFENTFDGVRCLLVVVEFLEGGDLLTRFEGQDRQPYTEQREFKWETRKGGEMKWVSSV